MFRKRVLAGIMIFSLLISISLVSAGIKDWFSFGDDSELEGELASQADVSVTLANSIPHIENWTEPDWDYVGSPGAVDAWPPVSCGTSTVQNGLNGGNARGIIVTISDANSDSDLDTSAAVDIQIKDDPSVPTVTIDGSCSLAAGTIDGDNFADFDCTFDMEFYHLPASDWVIEVIAATDDNAASADNVNQQSAGGSYPYFTYGSLYDIDLKDSDDVSYSSGDDTLLFSGVAADTTDKDADNNLDVQNCGNEQLDGTSPYGAGDSYVTVKGFDLSNPGDTDKMEPDTFSVDETATPCNSGDLLDNNVVIGNILKTPVINVALTPGASVEDSMYFCLEDINPSTLRGNDPITVDSYSTANLGGTQWQINACESGCQSI